MQFDMFCSYKRKSMIIFLSFWNSIFNLRKPTTYENQYDVTFVTLRYAFKCDFHISLVIFWEFKLINMIKVLFRKLTKIYSYCHEMAQVTKMGFLRTYRRKEEEPQVSFRALPAGQKAEQKKRKRKEKQMQRKEKEKKK